MKQLKLKFKDDPFLRRKSKQLETVKASHCMTALMMHKMLKTLGGLGLSAPQVGLDYALVVINTEGYVDGVKRTMFNPKVIAFVDEHVTFKFREGCLSFPNEFKDSEVTNEIAVEYTNGKNEVVHEIFKGMSAACVLHEINHLDGKLFKDEVIQDVRKD